MLCIDQLWMLVAVLMRGRRPPLCVVISRLGICPGVVVVSVGRLRWERSPQATAGNTPHAVVPTFFGLLSHVHLLRRPSLTLWRHSLRLLQIASHTTALTNHTSVSRALYAWHTWSVPGPKHWLLIGWCILVGNSVGCRQGGLTTVIV